MRTSHQRGASLIILSVVLTLLLIALSARQASLDRRLRADRGEVEAIGARIEAQLERDRRPLSVRDAVLLVAIAIVTAATGLWLGRLLPPVGDVLTPFAWGILIVTTAALLLSLTPLARLDGAGASSLGYAGFYLLLASVGAQADLKKIVTQPVWIVAGVVVMVDEKINVTQAILARLSAPK